jgi:hypothetical protein
MGTKSSKETRLGRVAQVAGWTAGSGITLVEMQFGMDYVLSHLVGQMSAIVGWLPMISVLARQFWA